MAGLGLSDALMSFRDGMAWRQQQDQYEKDQQRKDAIDQANAVAGDRVKAAEQEDYSNQRREWMAGGGDNAQFKPKPFVPSDSLMFQVAQARGAALMKAGLMDEAVKNEALVQNQRLRVRQAALEKFRIDKDHVKLAKTIYGTVADGKDIVEATTVEGAPEAVGIGAGTGAAPNYTFQQVGTPGTGLKEGRVSPQPSLAATDPGVSLPMQPTKINFILSDGTKLNLTPDEVENLALRLSDPAFATKEAETYLLQTKAKIDAEKQKEIERTKGEESRKTVDLKGNNARGLAEVKFGYDQQLHAADNASRERVGAGNNKATITAAQIGASSRVEVAGLRGAGGGGGSGGGSKGLLKTDTDANGNVRLYFRDGRTELAKTEDGQPIKSNAWAKRVDSTAKAIGETPAGIGKSPAELRKLAEEALASGGGAAPKPASSPGLSSAGKKDYSSLWN